MRKAIFLTLVIAMTINCLAQEIKSPLEGAWKLVYAKWGNSQFPGDGNFTISQIKMYSKEYHMHIGEFKIVSMNVNNKNYGVGTYKIVKDGCYETVGIVGQNENYVGHKSRILFEIREDSLILKFYPDENWKLPDIYNTEKYIRLR